VARLREIENRGQVPFEERELFDKVEELRGRVGLPYSVFLNHPPLAVLKLQLGSYVRFNSTVPKDIAEVVICTAARLYECEFELFAHTRAARNAGVDEASLNVILEQADSTELEEGYDLAITFTRQLLVQHRIEDSVYEAAVSKWGERSVLELIATIGYYVMSACWMNALEIQPPQ
jgi:4-carboxymuconolactone decarboxylase